MGRGRWWGGEGATTATGESHCVEGGGEGGMHAHVHAVNAHTAAAAAPTVRGRVLLRPPRVGSPRADGRGGRGRSRMTLLTGSLHWQPVEAGRGGWRLRGVGV